MADFLVFERGTAIAPNVTGDDRPAPEVPGNLDVPAVNISDWLSLELPRFLSGDAAKLGAIAVKPNDQQTGVEVVLNEIVSSTVFSFQPAAITVTAQVSETIKQITLSSSALADDEYVYIESPLGAEFMKIKSSRGSVYQVDRGIGDTVPIAHPVTAKVWRVSSVYLWQSGNLTVEVPYNIALESSTSSSTRRSSRIDTHVIRGNLERYQRPICPADIKIGTAYRPSAVTGDVVISFRMRQKDNQIDWYDGTTSQTVTNTKVYALLETTRTETTRPAAAPTDRVILYSPTSDTTTASGMIQTFTAVAIRAAAGAATSDNVTVTVWAVETTGSGATAVTRRSLSLWQHTFNWSETAQGAQTGWDHDWGSNWGG